MRLIKVSAAWCGPCRMQKKEFIENPPAIEVEEVDCDDDEQGIVHDYAVKSIPTTLLLDDNGDVLNRWTGFTKTETINSYIENLQKAK